MLIHASRTLSSVGLTSGPAGALIFLPRQRPATMRTAGGGRREAGSEMRAPRSCFAHSNICNTGLEVALASVVVALEPECDVDLSARLEFSGAAGQSPSNRVERSGAGVQDNLESILPDCARGTRDQDVPSEENRCRVSN